MPVGRGGLRSVGADVSVSSLSRAFSLFLSAVPGDVVQKGSSTSIGSVHGESPRSKSLFSESS